MGQTNGKLLICCGCQQGQLNVPVSIDFQFACYLNIHMARRNAVHHRQMKPGGAQRTPAKAQVIDGVITWNFLIGLFKPVVRQSWVTFCEELSNLKGIFSKCPVRRRCPVKRYYLFCVSFECMDCIQIRIGMWEGEGRMMSKGGGVQLTCMLLAGKRLKQDLGTSVHNSLT